MKKFLLSLAVITLATLLVLSACKKGNEKIAVEEQFTTSNRAANRADVDARPGPVAAFYKTYGPQARKYTINAGEDGEIKLPSGGTINIPAGAFAINGNAITNGNVEVTVLDLPDRGAMAMNGVNTMVGEGLLVSNGNLDLQANVNGQPVDRDLAKNIQISVPDRARIDVAPNLFEGVSNDAEQFDWVPTLVPGQENDIPAVNNLFTFNWPIVGRINIDWFWWWAITSRASSTTLQVDLINNPGTLSTYLGGTGNTVVLFVPKGRNTIVQLYNATSTGVSSIGNSIPAGINGRLLAYSITASGYYIATKDITTTNSNPMVESLTFTSTTPAVLTAALTALSSY